MCVVYCPHLCLHCVCVCVCARARAHAHLVSQRLEDGVKPSQSGLKVRWAIQGNPIYKLKKKKAGCSLVFECSPCEYGGLRPRSRKIKPGSPRKPNHRWPNKTIRTLLLEFGHYCGWASVLARYSRVASHTSILYNSIFIKMKKLAV